MLEIDGFEWDAEKARINQLKHGITFPEAISVFYDDNAILIPDPDHSFLEERFLLLGMSERSGILSVVHCERYENIRIISARRATNHEKQQYKYGRRK